MTVHVESEEIIWQKAFKFLINWLSFYHNIGQKTLLLLSGGSVVEIYHDLAKFINTSDLNFSFLAFAQIDERFFGKKQRTDNKEQINAEIIRKTGLWETCDKRKIPYYLVPQEGTLIEAVGNYDKQIEKLFKQFTYKIGLLGIGKDGHTAGLLPGYESIWTKNQLVVGYKVDNGQNILRAKFCQQFKERVSITPKSLTLMDQAIIVAVGEKKRSVIREILDPININNINKYPGALLQKIKKVDLFTNIDL